MLELGDNVQYKKGASKWKKKTQEEFYKKEKNKKIPTHNSFLSSSIPLQLIGLGLHHTDRAPLVVYSPALEAAEQLKETVIVHHVSRVSLWGGNKNDFVMSVF